MGESTKLLSFVEHGTSVFTVTGNHLIRFINLIDYIENEGYGGDQNIFKLRLDQSSAHEGTQPKKLVNLLRPYIRKHAVLQELRKYPFCNESYGYKKICPGECSLIQTFAKKMGCLSNYLSRDSCCSENLKTFNSPALLLEHFFEILESFAVEVCSERSKGQCHVKEQLMENAAQLRSNYEEMLSTLGDKKSTCWKNKALFEKCTRVDCFSFSDSESESESEEPQKTTDDERLQAMKNYPIYSAGIQLNKDQEVMITKTFGMSSIKSIIDLLPHKYSGLNIPQFYVGEQHSVFAAHIEDAALYAVNYLHVGSAKVWVTISPQFCDKLRSCIPFLKMELAHTSCVNSLNHKYFFFTTNFLKENCIPYHITVQYEGEMVVLRPNTVHFGFNCGPNIAEACNFATISWIPEGIKAQRWRCRC